MTAIGMVLVLTAILFFLGIIVWYLLLLLIGKITEPRKKDGEDKKAEGP